MKENGTCIDLVPVEVSNRHIHLSKQDLEILFAKEDLTVERMLSQPGQFLAKETITLVSERGKIENVRIIGPLRDKTQVEILQSDARYRLKIDNVPVNLSGNHENSKGLKLRSLNGEIDVNSGLIIAKRHLHIPVELAKKWNLLKLDAITLKLENGKMLNDVIVRAHEKSVLSVHIDVDEAIEFGIERFKPKNEIKKKVKICEKNHNVVVRPSIYGKILL